MLGDDRGGRRLVPPQSIFGHAIRDRLHLVRSEALELRRVRGERAGMAARMMGGDVTVASESGSKAATKCPQWE